MLGEAVVHGEDIRRPLGLSREIPEETLVAVADFYKGSNLLIEPNGESPGSVSKQPTPRGPTATARRWLGPWHPSSWR